MKNRFIITATSFTLASLVVFSQIADAESVKVKKGDTLYSLSKKYEVSLTEFMKYNKLTSSNIYVGQSLSVPEKPVKEEVHISEGAKKQVNTVGDTLNVRTGASVNYKKIGELKHKTIVTVISTKNGWSYIDYNGLKGYVNASYLQNVVAAPTPTTPPVTTPTPTPTPTNAKTYIVVKGDTLYKIGQKFGVSYQTIKNWNNLTSNDITVNQKLIVSEPSKLEEPKAPVVQAPSEQKTYTVKKGDSLSKIANAHNISLQTLKSLNSLKSDLIHPGDVLVVSKASNNLNMPFINPAEGTLTSYYGERIHPITHKRSFHYGIDIAKKGIVPIHAAFDGVVIRSKMDADGWGNYVVIEHQIGGKTYATLYAHMRNREVSVGDRVTQGQQLGLMGTTGNSTGQHLHLEVYENGYNYPTNSVDPLKYFY